MNTINGRISNIVGSGLRAQALAVETDLGKRLPAGTLDSLKQDVANLSDLSPGKDVAMTSVRALTGKQLVVCTRAFHRIAAIRRTVVRQTLECPEVARRLRGI